MVKTFKNIHLQNRKSDLETWHVALGTRWLTLTYFMARSNWVAYALNGENCYKAI